MNDITAESIAKAVIAKLPKGTKTEWGAEFVRQARAYNLRHWNDWLEDTLARACGGYVAGVAKRVRELSAEHYRVNYNGRAMTETISVRADNGARQQSLWVDVSPTQWMEAVLREEAVVTGRAKSNEVRLRLVNALSKDPDARALPTMRDVCVRMGWDPKLIDLDDEAAS